MPLNLYVCQQISSSISAPLHMITEIPQMGSAAWPGCACWEHQATRVGPGMDPLHWLTMDECGPARLHSGSKTEDTVYKGPLRRHVVHGHGAHLSLGQHRHRLHPSQGAPR